MTESEIDSDEMLEFEVTSDSDRVDYPVEDEALVARHALSTHIKMGDMEQQREYISYKMLC